MVFWKDEQKVQTVIKAYGGKKKQDSNKIRTERRYNDATEIQIIITAYYGQL